MPTIDDELDDAEKRAHELRNIVVGEISLVDRPANRRPFLLWKSIGGLTAEACKGLSDEELERLHALTHTVGVADVDEEANTPASVVAVGKGVVPMADSEKTTDEVTPAEVVANVTKFLQQYPQLAPVAAAALQSDPALAAAYCEGVTSGAGGELLLAKARAKAEIAKSQRPGKHPYLVAVDSAVQKSAAGADYAKIAADVAREDPEVYASYCDEVTYGRRR